MVANPQTKPGKGCERCGWPYDAFHVCIDASDPETKKVKFSEDQVVKNDRARYSGKKVYSAEERAVRSANVKARWARQREIDAPRDAEIVRLYKDENISMRGLVRQFGIHRQTIMGILHRAAEAGLVTIRPAGGVPRDLRKSTI